MRLRLTLALTCLLWKVATPTAQAGTPTPLPASPPPIVIQPTSVPPVATPPPVTDSSPVPTSDVPVPVAKERNSPTIKVTAPALAPTEAPSVPPASQEPSPGTTLPPTWNPPTIPTHAAPAPGSLAPQAPVQSPVQAPPSAPLDLSVIDPASQSAYQAPAQLTCTGKSHPAAGPFLSSPYSGWTDINSFVDHDYPDYANDGLIIIANGIEAKASQGQESDFFPAYWSDSMRQYISYDGHNGYDFGISYQPILAAAAGTVKFAGWNGPSEYDGYGQMVLIDHHNGYFTLYGHLSRLEVKKGDKVTAGQEIGISGTTGHSSGPHLHFSVFHDCQVTDPYGWTGHGDDPLHAFNGEDASYLWLPGQDPLVLNPPPNWPTFPLGLKISSAQLKHLNSYRTRAIPPADRLLLLSLPHDNSGSRVAPGVALARTEAMVSQEATTVAPYLDDLRREGLLETYQVVPAAAAIWLRGTATASQLQGLPGVASLSGGSPEDLNNAQAGLSHSILAQAGPQHVPSLWPIGFRSALQSWRPVLAVAMGHALVAGFALPGRRVVVTMRRGTGAPAAGESVTDAQSGGFVVMLHDAAGNPVTVRTGDVISAASAGRNGALAIRPFALSARSRRLLGSAQPNTPVGLAVISAERPAGRAITTTDSHGNFALRAKQKWPAGTLAVASMVDASGNQQSATAYVPGIVVSEGDSVLRGWTVGASPHIWVLRHRAVLLKQAIHPASDGAFELSLIRHGHRLILNPGDIIRVGSVWHSHRFTLPGLTFSLTPGATSVATRASRTMQVSVRYDSVDGATRDTTISISPSSQGSFSWPFGTVAVGDTMVATWLAASGDMVEVREQARGIIVHEGKPTITGRIRPGITLTVHVLSSSGQRIGTGIATSDIRTGAFKAVVRSQAGTLLPVLAGMRVEIRDEDGIESSPMPALGISVGAQLKRVRGKAPHGDTVTVIVQGARGQRQSVRVGAAGTFRIAMPAGTLNSSSTVSLSLVLPNGVSIEREASVRRPHSVSSRRTTQRRAHPSRHR